MCLFLGLAVISYGAILMFLTKYLVVFKVIRLPLTLEKYRKFSRWFMLSGIVLIAVLALNIFFIQKLITFSSAFQVVTLSVPIFTLTALCPNCGKILALPVRGGHKTADVILEKDSCPECDFSFNHDQA